MKSIFIIIILLTFRLSEVFSQVCVMQIRYKNGTKMTIPILDIQKITFNDLSTAVTNNSNVTQIIKTFTLFQNYPNPFNPSTSLEYELPHQGNINIKIFNLHGQTIKNLLNCTQPAGRYKIVWDGTNNQGEMVASGLYFYQVNFENIVLTRKLTIIK